MKTNQHYIVAIDFSPACRRALREAVRRATLDQAPVTAVHVLNESLVHELTQALHIEAITVRKDWEVRLRHFVDDTACGGKPVMTELRLGPVFEGILEACQYHKASLLIMGSSGSGSAEHRIGAVAAQCIRGAPLDVMVVRQDAPEQFHQILTCIDFSSNSVKALKRAIQLAKQDAAMVHGLFVHQAALLYTVGDYGFMPMAPMALEDATGTHWRQQLNELIDPLAVAEPNVCVKKIFESRLSIREAIIDTALSTAADLVVLGKQGGHGLRHFLIGTTAEKIIQHAPCSILAVKPDEETADLG